MERRKSREAQLGCPAFILIYPQAMQSDDDVEYARSGLVFGIVVCIVVLIHDVATDFRLTATSTSPRARWLHPSLSSCSRTTCGRPSAASGDLGRPIRTAAPDPRPVYAVLRDTLRAEAEAPSTAS